MTPFEFDILLHYYVSPAPHRVEMENPPAWASTRKWLLSEGLLREEKNTYGGSYRTTDRADCFIKHVLELPLPVWTMPQSGMNNRSGNGEA